jgi:hypothetical protein
MPDTTICDPAAEGLAGIRARGYHNGETGAMAHRLSDAAAEDVPRLLAAVEAVLALHQPGVFVLLGHLCAEHKMYRMFSITSDEADRVHACPHCSAVVVRACTCGHPAWPCPACQAIACALTTEEATP